MCPSEFPILNVLNRSLSQHLVSSDRLNIGCVALLVDDEAQGYRSLDASLTTERRVKRHWSRFEIRLQDPLLERVGSALSRQIEPVRLSFAALL